MPQTNFDRFMSKVDQSGGPDACHPWTGVCNPKGYGQFRADGQMRQAHRWLLAYLRGEPLRWDSDKREEACHSCDNRSCCNPAHLYVGDHASNMADMSARGRSAQASRTHCPAGHPYSPENTYAHPTSGRQCKACQRARIMAARRAAGSQPQGPKSSCPQGHRYDEANTYVDKRTGKKYCRACNAASKRARRA